jgi:hypothetical protein
MAGTDSPECALGDVIQKTEVKRTSIVKIGQDRSRRNLLIIGALTLAMSAPAVLAEEWEYGLLIYGWLPSIDGHLNYGLPGDGGGISVDADKILDALQFTFMGSFDARKGRWSAFTDVIYLDLEGDKSKAVALPGGSSAVLLDADMELTGWVWTLGGTYTLWQDQTSHFDLLAGARLLSLETDLHLSGGGPAQQELKLNESKDLWDGIVGVKGRWVIDDHWFVPYYADIGTGDTDLTWQFVGGIGYAFDWGDVILDYRYLGYDQGSDKLLDDLAFGGPMLGVGFHF